MDEKIIKEILKEMDEIYPKIEKTNKIWDIVLKSGKHLQGKDREFWKNDCNDLRMAFNKLMDRFTKLEQEFNKQN